MRALDSTTMPISLNAGSTIGNGLVLVGPSFEIGIQKRVEGRFLFGIGVETGYTPDATGKDAEAFVVSARPRFGRYFGNPNLGILKEYDCAITIGVVGTVGINNTTGHLVAGAGIEGKYITGWVMDEDFSVFPFVGLEAGYVRQDEANGFRGLASLGFFFNIMNR